MKNPKSNIAGRINHLLESNNLTIYEFCKQENVLDKWKTFRRALSQGDPDNVSPILINLIYNRFKDQVSMIYLMTGDSDKSVNFYLDKIKELKKDNWTVSEIFNTSYAEIKKIVDKAESKTKESKK
jgi:hypothetical protein